MNKCSYVHIVRIVCLKKVEIFFIKGLTYSVVVCIIHTSTERRINIMKLEDLRIVV